MQYTSSQQCFSGLIQHRLDYIFISHNFQEVFKDSEIIRTISTDHLALFCSFRHFRKLKKGSDLQKFNDSLGLNEDFIQKCTEHIQKVFKKLNLQTQFCDQTK